MATICFSLTPQTAGSRKGTGSFYRYDMKKFILIFSFLLFANLANAQTPTSLCAPRDLNCVTGLTASSSATLSSDRVIKNSAGNLYSFQVSADSTLSGAAWWVMIFDDVAAPADGAVTPKKCYAMASGQTSFSAAWLIPVTFQNGIVISVSTTGCFTKTASVHAYISGDIP